MKRLILAAAAMAALTFAAGSAGATDYSNSLDAYINYFGAPDTTSYGEVFFAPGGTLASWTFFDGDPTATGAKLVIADWDGGVFDTTGPKLFDSLTQTVAFGGGEYSHTFSGINLNLTAGNDYIAFLTVAGVANPTGEVSVGGSNGGPLGGGFVFKNSDGADPMGTGAWDTWYVPHQEFSATFGAAPEPAAWALMMAGFGLAGAALRRRQAAVAA
jgi:hypothetical protein